jgi:hypothetical protein
MQRDMDLVRELLLQIEEHPLLNGMHFKDLSTENHASVQAGTPATLICLRACSDLVPQFPKLSIGNVLHALLQHLDGRSHRPYGSAAYDSLC